MFWEPRTSGCPAATMITPLCCFTSPSWGSAWAVEGWVQQGGRLGTCRPEALLLSLCALALGDLMRKLLSYAPLEE